MRPEDVVSIGDEITVMVIEVDPQGRINRSRRAALSGEMPSQAEMDSDRGPSRGPGRGGPGRSGGFGRDRDNLTPSRGSGGYDRGGYGDRGNRSGGYDRGGYGERGNRPGGYGNERGGNFGQRRPMGPGPGGPNGPNRGPRREGGFGNRPPDRRW